MAQAKQVLSQPSNYQQNPIVPQNIADNMVKSNFYVDVSTPENHYQTISLSELISDAKQKGMSVIITSMSGPFLKKDSLPLSWMDTRCARGCTPQGNAFEGAMREKLFPQTEVFLLNIHPIMYQISLLEEKQWSNLRTIAFPSETALDDFKKELNLPTIIVDGKEYLARFTIAIKADGQTKLFTLESPVDEKIATRHVESIAEFLKADLAADKKLETPKFS